uniref:Uncharacterized protein n=1 Tax=Arundo donax TaxID=35708 RepID=A0A0A9EH87_ARUDO
MNHCIVSYLILLKPSLNQFLAHLLHLPNIPTLCKGIEKRIVSDSIRCKTLLHQLPKQPLSLLHLPTPAMHRHHCIVRPQIGPTL